MPERRVNSLAFRLEVFLGCDTGSRNSSLTDLRKQRLEFEEGEETAIFREEYCRKGSHTKEELQKVYVGSS